MIYNTIIIPLLYPYKCSLWILEAPVNKNFRLGQLVQINISEFILFIQVICIHFFRTKPLPEPLMTHCQMSLEWQTWVIFE